MADDNHSLGYKLPIKPDRQRGTIAQGFVTPKQDKIPQIQNIPPRRVIPIIFIPGIMGSNLRMKAERQSILKKSNNIAWRPDHLIETVSQANDSAIERQLRLDPQTTELDTYEPITNPTGNEKETADQRAEEVRVTFGYSAFERFDGPLLQNDLPGTPNLKNKDQKARERGWGEVYFSSYQRILTTCEERLNAAFAYRSLDTYLKKFVAKTSPQTWQADAETPLNEIDEEAIRNVVKGCWFPVHAMGYNWLKGNSESGINVAKRIVNLIKNYNETGFQCEKVILITHSMGGLVARAAIHPNIGNINDQVLGIVHGVMPAIGAGTAYKRIRCGFEGSGISTKILGSIGSHVTSVLANSQGGLELLPSSSYGNGWLQITQNGEIIKSLPKNSDPYEEIYKIPGKWFGLLRENWINPARIKAASFENTCALLDKAKKFHITIASTYHDNGYAHYGADSKRSTWKNVVWEIKTNSKIHDVEKLLIVSDDEQGKLKTINSQEETDERKKSKEIEITLRDAADPGDQTVPLHSSDAQLKSKKFKGIFRQTGYEHQSSYNEEKVVAATLYSIFQIASKMNWSK